MLIESEAGQIVHHQCIVGEARVPGTHMRRLAKEGETYVLSNPPREPGVVEFRIVCRDQFTSERSSVVDGREGYVSIGSG